MTPPALPTRHRRPCQRGSRRPRSARARSTSRGAPRPIRGGSGLKGYNVYDGGSLIASPTGTSYVNTGLAAGSTHTYTVSAVDNAGNQSAQSTPVTAVTPGGGGGGGGGGGIALVRQVAASEASSSTLTVPLTGGTTAGDGLVAAIALKAGSSASVSSVQDSSGATWTRGAAGFLTGTDSRVELWYRLGAPSLSSVTITLSAAKSAAAELSEWSGLAAVDKAAGGSNASTTTATTPTITTTAPFDLVIGAINYPNNVTSTLSTAGFSPLTRLRLLHHRPRPCRLRPDHRYRRLPGRLDALRRERWSGGRRPGAQRCCSSAAHEGAADLGSCERRSAAVGQPRLVDWSAEPLSATSGSAAMLTADHASVFAGPRRARYRVVHRDSGHRLRIRVTAVNTAGSRPAISRPTAHVP